MLIDWFTVVAQIINFLVLVWLLKRYLYNPILKALDERERKVASQLHDAANAKAEAQNEKNEFQRKNDEFDKERKSLFTKVSKNAADEQNRLFSELRNELESFRLKQLESLEKEYQKLRQEIALKTQQEIFAIAKKTLLDLANIKLEESIAEMFIKQLRSLEGEEKELLASAVKSSRQVRIQSVFELLPTQRIAIENTVKEKFAIEIEFRFETVSSLMSGIELITGGYKVSWNIADYISALEKSVDSILEEKKKKLTGKGS
jgi:F-type H+-transporting ATPase subunit b